MPAFSIIENFQVKTNQEFLDKAAALEPVLYEETVTAKRLVTVTADAENRPVLHPQDRIDALSDMAFQKGDKVIIDFGAHQTGYLTFTATAQGSHYDAPAFLKLKFAEVFWELAEDADEYNGWLSRSWIQEEWLHLRILPDTVRLPARYAFRYLQIEVIDTSPKYALKFEQIFCTAVSSAGEDQGRPYQGRDELLKEIDKASVKTLKECMQKVFEDGVKRDRRLWLGDLRLQARTNYVTFQNYDLVKRCLYLFAGMTFEDGRMSACFFHEPQLQADDTYLLDYALLFASVLWEYYEASGDAETMLELYPAAAEQIDICLNTMMDENHTVSDQGEAFWCFLDWGEGLNKQAGAQAVLIYSMRFAIRLAEAAKDERRVRQYASEIEILKKAAREQFWDETQGMFVSGSMRQVSWASQVWMVLAEVLDQEQSRQLLLHTRRFHPAVRMVTPYMYHHYIDALILCGEEELALEELKRFWGGMIQAGADTFWEVYDPDNRQESPYGSTMVNSYCHAWSCTPAYLLRTFYRHK